MANKDLATNTVPVIEEFVDWMGDFFTEDERSLMRKAAHQDISPELEQLRILQWNLLYFRDVERDGLFPSNYLYLAEPDPGDDKLLDTDERDNLDNPLRQQLTAEVRTHLQEAEEFLANFSAPRNFDGYTGLSAQEVKDFVKWAKQRWDDNNAKERFRIIAEAVSHRKEINKVIMIGSGVFLDKVLMKKDGANRYNPLRLASLLAAQSLAALFAERGHKVSLYACSWDYDESTKSALGAIGFEILDGGYNKHEQYRLVDRNTLVWGTGLSHNNSILPQLAVGTWPAAMILTDPYTYDWCPWGEDLFRASERKPSQIWSRMRRVSENQGSEWVVVPGLVGAVEKSRGRLDVPFHTSEAGRMWDQFRPLLFLGGPQWDITQFTFLYDDPPFEVELRDHDTGSICRKGASLFVRKEAAQEKTYYMKDLWFCLRSVASRILAMSNPFHSLFLIRPH
ncbi:hypothetical protein F5Y18DRAFT_326745 [Xylariaceae sp. FL1019]|nr:hypothetical protein F5Y18DRAFT_326745 [Xylariaceae sp. FL1019]